MSEIKNYPENRLDIRIDENGNITYEQKIEFAKFYAPTKEEKVEEMEELRDRLELLDLDEPDDEFSVEYEEWEEEKRRLEEEIADLEDEINDMA